MTVEAITTIQEPFGLTGERTRDVENTRIVEYRNSNLTHGNTSCSKDDPLRAIFGLDYGPRDEYGLMQINTPKSWAIVIGEDAVLVDRLTFETGAPRRTNEVTLYREEINAANLTTEDGKTKLTWRETQPGDYPEATLYELSNAEVIVFYQDPHAREEAA